MNRDTTYHFVGIKGSGMSALALILAGMGYNVQGSDLDNYFFTQKGLDDANIPIYPFDANNIQPGLTLIVGNAFPDTHEEVMRAMELGLSITRYPEFLSGLLSHHTSVAITGSHGKTSTTGLLAHVLKGLDQTSYLIGDGTGFGALNSNYFILEACEYKRTFMSYHPDYAIITNVDFDHPDYYLDIEDVFDAFQSFSHQVKKALVVAGDDPYASRIQSDLPVYHYGFNETNHFQIKNVEKMTTGSAFDLYVDGALYDRFTIPTFGTHNILNATAVIAITYLEGVDKQAVKEQLLTFKGVKRRFSEKRVNDMIIIDDYAHHPQEIRATLDAAHQKYPDKEIVAVFQPHTFTRTVALMSDFADALKTADHVFLCDIFGSVREDKGDVTIFDLARLIEGSNVLTLDDMSPLLDFKDAVCIFMGAGDVQKFERAYEKILSETTPNQL
ncbi:UDP-N-acetylmuramate--L-alanine ligase [Atopobacter phocae]|uniref:UDP-N-acetylmuramate--L-alanine ligase n=1 Tax=Atopobacter phocae TaxID=136492 RepID=UPI0004BCF988